MSGLDLSLISGGSPVEFVDNHGKVIPVEFVGLADSHGYGVIFYNKENDSLIRAKVSDGFVLGGGFIRMVPEESTVYLVARNGKFYSTVYTDIATAQQQWAFIDRKNEFEIFEVNVKMDSGKPLYQQQ